MDAVDPPILPGLQTCSRVFIASDYSGQHQGSPYETYSFLIASGDSLVEWHRRRSGHRRRHPHGRTYSYKKLADGVRLGSMWDFLQATDALDGVLVTVGVNTRINSLFTYDRELLTSSSRYAAYQHWRPGSFERAVRVTSIATFFLAGLVPIVRNLHWLSDNDETLSNDQHVEDFHAFLTRTTDAFFQRRLETIKVTTISSETDRLRAEDFVAPTDLAAGAIAEFLIHAPDVSDVVMPMPVIPAKALWICNWLADTSTPLKRLVFALEPIPSGKSFKIRDIHFPSLVPTAGEHGHPPMLLPE